MSDRVDVSGHSCEHCDEHDMVPGALAQRFKDERNAARVALEWAALAALANHQREVVDPVGVSERIETIVLEMERAADLDRDDPNRPVTRYDARRWAKELRALAPPREVVGDE